MAIAAASAAIIAIAPQPAMAASDSVYVPSTGWNGVTIYLSTACHDGSDGVPGGPCITNLGCSGYSENATSDLIALYATTVLGGGSVGLLHRGYRVIVGQGTVDENIARSNAAKARLHIPIHSNAGSSGACGGGTTLSRNGTHVLYVSTAGAACSVRVRDRVGAYSPGTGDRTVYRSDLGELNRTSATACYLEAEFHDWPGGATWLRSSLPWAGSIGLAVDQYLGYP